MIEFNGWVKLAFSTDGESEATAEAAAALHTLTELVGVVNQTRTWGSFPLIEARNGYAYLHLAGAANRLGVDWHETLHLLHQAARLFPGAYGTVYLRDDEDPLGQDNGFYVYVVRRGVVSCVLDTLLSPCNPVIEE
jgi:hypothetical protein